MIKSEIFEQFIKIAEAKGMISNDSNEAKKKLEQTKRNDSLDISAIEALYGVKPNTPKDMEYDLNIMENAHPNSVIVAPSYDKLNGLVENNIERQNILLNIVNKTPNGLSTQHKYAETALNLSLIRIANELDNKDEDKLRAYADFCLTQLNKKTIQKIALYPALIVGTVALVGAIYAHQHLPNLSEGLKKDYDQLMSELNDFVNSNTNYGIGHEYDDALKKDVDGLRQRLEAFWHDYSSLDKTIRELEVPRNGKEYVAKLQEPKSEEVSKAYQKIAELVQEIGPYIKKMKANFESPFYKERHTKETGMISSFFENLHLSGGRSSLLADDFQDVVNAIPPFESSIVKLLEMFDNAKSLQNKLEQDLRASQSEIKTVYDIDMKNPLDKSKVPSKSVEDIDSEVSNLDKMWTQ